MKSIAQIRILSDLYNYDVRNPTAYWPEDPSLSLLERGLYSHESTYEKGNISNKLKIKEYNLPEGVLPKGHTIEIPDKSKIITIIGPNGIGKTTFLKALSHSVENAQIYEKTKHSNVFGANIGMMSCARNEDHFAAFGGFDCFYEKDEEHKTSHLREFGHSGSSRWTEMFSAFDKYDYESSKHYKQKAISFYLGREEIFSDNIFFDYYKDLSKETLEKRLSWLGDLNSERELDFLKKFVQEQQKTGGLEYHELLARMAFISEHSDLIARAPFPINKFGQYEIIGMDNMQNLNCCAYSSELHKKNSDQSKGQYARETFTGMLETLSQSPNKKHLLLLDEPTANTDLEGTKWMYEQFFPALMEAKHCQTFVATNDYGLVQSLKGLGSPALDMYKKPAVVREMR